MRAALLLVAVGAALLLVAVGAALLLLLVADGRGAALHLVAVGAESQQYDTHAQLKYHFNALTSWIVFSNDPAFALRTLSALETNASAPILRTAAGRSCNNLLS